MGVTELICVELEESGTIKADQEDVGIESTTSMGDAVAELKFITWKNSYQELEDKDHLDKGLR